jgi:limonene-1,2-epoxide hydrolase
MPDHTKSPIEVVRAFNAAMEKKDFHNGLRYVADDCEYTNGPMGTARGPAGVRAMLEPFFTPVLEQTFIVKREAASGPVVFMERLDRHRMPTGWIELPVTGVYEVHDGRITLWHEYFDLATIQNQMTAAAR